jgi:hypothetical protein
MGNLRIAEGTGTSVPELAWASVRKVCRFKVDDTFTAEVISCQFHSPTWNEEDAVRVEWRKNGRRLPSNRPIPDELAARETELKRLALVQWGKLSGMFFGVSAEERGKVMHLTSAEVTERAES